LATVNAKSGPRATSSSRRERKKRLQSKQIVPAARELFIAQGFDETTITDIAERADISVSTFFNYFPTKVDVLFARHDEALSNLPSSVQERAAEESALDAIHAWQAERRGQYLNGSRAGDQIAEAGWLWGSLRSTITESSELETEEYGRFVAVERGLAAEIAKDLGDKPSDLRPRLISAMRFALMLGLARFIGDEPRHAEDHAALETYLESCVQAAAEAIASVPPPQEAESQPTPTR
jgi:AcrR family transcriptional regulator